MRWVMDKYILDRAEATYSGYPNLMKAALDAGHEVHLTSMNKGKIEDIDSISFDSSKPVVTYGSHQFVSQIERKFASQWVPCSYHRVKNLSYSTYSAYIGDLMMNDDFILLPYAEAKRRLLRDRPDGVFIRPDSVTKSFAGFFIKQKDLDSEFNSLDQISKPDPDMLTVIASPKDIKAEFRFVIVDREVVTGSEYRWDGRLDIRIDVDESCLELAKEVANREWQPDIAYTCDVALVDFEGKTEARVIELNAFSCSGLYACDTRKIVQAIEKAATMEYTGDIP